MGIRVNAVSPVGWSAMSRFSPNLPDPEVNAPAVLFLLSDRAHAITGQIIRIHGAMLSLMTHPANRAPVLERADWNLDRVAAAFDQTLAELQLPTNVATYQISRIDTGFGAKE